LSDHWASFLSLVRCLCNTDKEKGPLLVATAFFWSFPYSASFAIPPVFFGAFPGALPCAKLPAAQPLDIPGWSALDAGVACLSRSSLHRQILPASARFGRRVYISASGRQFRYSTLAGLQFTHTSLPEALNK